MVYGLKIPTPPAPDAGDAREFQLQAAASTAGPWREQASFKGPLDHQNFLSGLVGRGGRLTIPPTPTLREEGVYRELC